MAGELFVVVNGEVAGPFSKATMSQLWNAATVDAGTKCWAAGMPGWTTIGAYKAEQRLTEAQVLVTSAPMFATRDVYAEVGIVGGEAAFATQGSPIEELAGALSDLVSGPIERPSALQRSLRLARASAMAQVHRQAAELDADGVLAVRIEHAQVAAHVLVVATGTAVRLRPPAV